MKEIKMETKKRTMRDKLLGRNMLMRNTGGFPSGSIYGVGRTWFFVDETGKWSFGPFPTEREAKKALSRYEGELG